MQEYENYQNTIPYNINEDLKFFDTIFNHKENFALAQAAFYAATGEFRKAQLIMHNEKNFNSKNHRQIAWLILSSSIRKVQNNKEVLFDPYLVPTLSYLNGMGKQEKVQNIIDTLSDEKQAEVKTLLEKASNTEYYCEPKIINAKHSRYKHRTR